MLAMRIRCDNTYSDGRVSQQFHDVEVDFVYAGSTDDDDLEGLWDALYEYTGDGSGVDDKHAYYEATIVACDTVPALVGLTHDWGL